MQTGRFLLKSCKGKVEMKSFGMVRALGLQNETLCPSCIISRLNLKEVESFTVPTASAHCSSKREKKSGNRKDAGNGNFLSVSSFHAPDHSTNYSPMHSQTHSRILNGCSSISGNSLRNASVRRSLISSNTRHSKLSVMKIRVHTTASASCIHDEEFMGFESELLYSRIQKLETKPSIRNENLTFTTFNILAPIYKRMNGNENLRESEERNLWVQRNMAILSMLLEKKSSVICLQEFWLANEELVELYKTVLERAGYDVLLLPRTNNRGDGLFTAVKKDQLRILDHQRLLFNDCGDRVAQILRLQIVASTTSNPNVVNENKSLHQMFSCPFTSSPLSIPSSPSTSESMELIVVNTHLIFPHNQHYSLMRIRQVYKILQFMESYQSKNNLSNVPVLLCGDLNGSKRGNVYKFLRSRGFVSSYDMARRYSDEDSQKWVSHKNHRGNICGVDFIWLKNSNCEEKLMLDDWIKVIILAIKTELNALGYTSNKDIFQFFQSGNTQKDHFTLDEFKDALTKLDLRNEESLGLTDEEANILLKYIDVNETGLIQLDDFVELFDVRFEQPCQGTKKKIHTWISKGTSLLERFSSASHPLSSSLSPSSFPSFFLSTQNSICASTLTLEKRKQSRFEKNGCSPAKQKALSFEIKDAYLYPPEAESGKWPENWNLSDHTPLTAVFKPSLSP